MPKKNPAPSEVSRRLPKAERRAQLLDTALAMVREQGTDALTLGSLAERAGVTKPITYEHFGTRAGLLIALAQGIDDKQVLSLQTALTRARPKLDELAKVIGKAYVDCCIQVGAEWYAISGALKGDEQMDAVLRALNERYAALYEQALAPHTSLSKRELQLRCLAILGAADAIARELLAGRVETGPAAATLAALITAAVPPKR